ncbi:Tn3 family transposase [Streptomyces wedmorensis]
MQQIIAEMRAEGIYVRDEDIARLSPLKFAHINFYLDDTHLKLRWGQAN